jgi:hypothetical protein
MSRDVGSNSLGALNLTQDQRPLNLWSLPLVKLVEFIQVLLNTWRHSVVNFGTLSAYNLSQVGDLTVDGIFYLMQLVPQILLDLLHVRPSIHPIGLNVLNLLCVFLLSLTITVDIFESVGFIWTFDDDLSHFLRSLYFINLCLFLESSLNDLADRKVVNLLSSLQLGQRNALR